VGKLSLMCALSSSPSTCKHLCCLLEMAVT
jgi:hypothetical protein